MSDLRSDLAKNTLGVLCIAVLIVSSLWILRPFLGATIWAAMVVVATWPLPGGGSPDMGNVSADGRWLWLSARYDDVVYRVDTTTGEVTSIPVGREPHGLTVWPQPGRYSVGHTGNMR